MLQASLRRNPAPDPRRDPASVGSQLGALKFEIGQKAIFLGRAYYGCVATILPPVTAGLSRKVKALWPVILALDLLVTIGEVYKMLRPMQPPSAEVLLQSQCYPDSGIVCAHMGLSPLLCGLQVLHSSYVVMLLCLQLQWCIYFLVHHEGSLSCQQQQHTGG